VKVAIYSRVSTLGKGQDVEVQARELREFAARRGWTVEAEFSDSGISGAKESRPALDRMLQAAKRRKFDGILIWKLDRIGRSLKHLVNLLGELESVGCALVSFSDNMDLSTPQGKLMFGIIGAMAEFERSLICERVKAGIAHRRLKGLKVGGRAALDLDMEEIKRLRSSGLSLAAIGKELGTTAKTIHGRLSQA
jgi:DNA invertase Pin-like site-specific DNA recombinase